MKIGGLYFLKTTNSSIPVELGTTAPHSCTTKLHNNFLTGQFQPMFLNIRLKIMKQTQKYRQLSLFDDAEENKAGTPLDQFEAPDQIQQVGTVRRHEHGEQRPFSGTAEMERG